MRHALHVLFASAALAGALIAVAWAGTGRGTASEAEAATESETESEAESESETETESEPESEREADAGTSFVAFAADFRDFRSWERIAVEGAMLPVGAAPGPTAVYVSQRAPAGAARWPVGTILVKSIENGPREQWVVHAMVKRGVPYNREGALGWEFFELAFDPGSDEPRIVWRGPGPPSGHGYAAMGRDAGPDPVPLVCNDCHAVAWQSDGALTPALGFER